MGEVQYCCLYRPHLLENLRHFTKFPNCWFKKQALYAQGPFNKERHVMFSTKCNSISVKRETPFICSEDPWSYSKRHQILAFLLLGWPSGPQSQISTLWKIVGKKKKMKHKCWGYWRCYQQWRWWQKWRSSGQIDQAVQRESIEWIKYGRLPGRGKMKMSL